MKETPQILTLDPAHPDHAAIQTAVDTLSLGHLVVLPTETVYGLAADPGVPGAKEKIFEAKRRPRDKAITLMAASLDSIREDNAKLGDLGQRLAESFWPGPLTMVLETPRGYEGYRIPDSAIAKVLLEKAGRLLAVTSANLSGRAPACTAGEAIKQVGPSVAMVLDGGPSPGTDPSTVVRVVKNGVEILREGAISKEELEACLRDIG